MSNKSLDFGRLSIFVGHIYLHFNLLEPPLINVRTQSCIFIDRLFSHFDRTISALCIIGIDTVMGIVYIAWIAELDFEPIEFEKFILAKVRG